MDKSKTMKTITYLLLLLCSIVCKISGDVTADEEFGSVDSDIKSLLNQDVSPILESFLQRRMSNILRSNPGLLKFVSEPVEGGMQARNKRLAGLENLDFMTGVFARLPMNTNAAMSDLQQRMRAVGR